MAVQNDELRSALAAQYLLLDYINFAVGSQNVAAVNVTFTEIAPGVLEGVCASPTEYFETSGEITSADLISTIVNLTVTGLTVSDFEGDGEIVIGNTYATVWEDVPIETIRVRIVIPSRF